MTIDEIDAMPLSALTHRDLAELLWESNRRLVDAIACVELAAAREEAQAEGPRVRVLKPNIA